MFKHQGWSLVEVITALMIAAVIMMVAVPLLKDNRARIHDRKTAMALMQAIQFARESALWRGTPIIFCQSNDQQHCVGRWTEGQLIGMDVARQGRIQNPADIISVLNITDNQGLLFWRSFPLYRHDLQMLPNGLTPSDNGTFWYCHDERALPVWAVVVSKAGQSRLVYPDKMGLIKDSEGRPFDCAADSAS